MNGAPQAGSAEAGPSTDPARVKKKAKPKQGKAVARKNTIPKPYLALAPAPVSLSGSRFHEAVSTSSLANLVLPSSYPRGAGLATPSGPMVMTAAGPSRHAPTGRTRKYAAGLLAPPTIMPGGVSASPRIQASARNGRRTPGGDTPEGDMHRNRSSERLRQISGSGANASMMSLGHTGRLLQSDPTAPLPIQLQDNGPVPEQVSTRRRRRVVRAEDDTLRRRLTVSTREEGRAMGLARGASMRRVNVWDDLPESSDPPPAFPFPTTATSRLPPTFETAQSSPPATERPRSPPPSFEQAIGLIPLPGPLAVVSEADEEEPPTQGADLAPEQEPTASRPTTPATDYASAPESPSGSPAPLPETVSEEERSDRQMWNMDLLSGYSLEERVRREMVRRKSREEDVPVDIPSAGASSAESSEQLAEDVSAQEAATVVPTPMAATPTHTSRPRPVINTAEEAIARSTGPSPTRASPSSASTPRGSTRTLHLSRSTSRLATSPKTPTATSSPNTALIMASTMANPPTAVKPPTTPTSPVSPLSTLRQSIQSPKTPDPEAVVDQSPPSRKLSRGHAIRRTSSVLKSDTGSVRSRRSAESPKQPLFSSPGLTAAQILGSPEPHRVVFEHRASEPPPVPLTMQTKLHQRTNSQPNLQRIAEDGADALPPHREAALKRRDLGITRIGKPVPQANSSAPTSPSKGDAKPSGPLIDFNHTLPAITAQPPAPNLGEHSAWTTELLQLLDEVQSPVAESSTQGAARTAAAAIVKAEVEAAVEAKVNAEKQERSVEEEAPPLASASPAPSSKKRAPPPPPPLSLRLKRQQGADLSPSGVVRRLSVLSTANSPIIPYTARSSTLRSPDPQDSPTSGLRGHSAPTRRPPPLPPAKYQPLAPAGPSGPSPSPPPPRFEDRPGISQVASFSTSESSEDATAEPERPPIRRPYTSLATRPRGPRPPPVPTRPWSKVVSQSWEEPQRSSPVARSPTDQPLNIRTDGIDRPQPPRSASVQDLRSPRRQRSNGRSPIEFTDLDVFVSRLEGSGREYEGFAQITSFLGPGKPTAATPAQIATLLPGLVSVDSRRTTAQGKVKLKLSLLGVRVSKCPICLSQFKDKDTGVMLPECSHVAHQVCATRWFRDESRCFVCREPLKE